MPGPSAPRFWLQAPAGISWARLSRDCRPWRDRSLWDRDVPAEPSYGIFPDTDFSSQWGGPPQVPTGHSPAFLSPQDSPSPGPLWSPTRSRRSARVPEKVGAAPGPRRGDQGEAWPCEKPWGAWLGAHQGWLTRHPLRVRRHRRLTASYSSALFVLIGFVLFSSSPEDMFLGRETLM